MQLHEEHRPKQWADVIGQDKAIRRIQRVGKRGLSGRAYWISGQSGTGKTTIGRLIAAENADDFAVDEIDAQDCTPKRIADIERSCRCRSFGKGGRAIIINEAHGLSKAAIRQLLVTLERIPSHVVWCFTTTVDGQESLFDDQIDAHPLLSRCVELPLSRRGLAEAFAERARTIAQTEGLDGNENGPSVMTHGRAKNHPPKPNYQERKRANGNTILWQSRVCGKGNSGCISKPEQTPASAGTSVYQPKGQRPVSGVELVESVDNGD